MIRRRRFKNRELANAWVEGLLFVNDPAIKDVYIHSSALVPGRVVVEFEDTDYPDDDDEDERDELDELDTTQ